jgi:hypothetical protein
VTEHREELVFGAIGGLCSVLGLLEIPLRPFPFGNVSRDLRDTYDPPFWILDGRDSQRDVNESAIHAPSLANPAEYLWLLVRSIRRNQNRDGFPENFIGLVAKNTLSSLIPAHDDAIQVLADDGVFGGSDDGSEAQHRLIRSFAVSNPLRRADETDGHAVLEKSTTSGMDPPFTSI